MKYENMVEGKFLARPNRFIAHIEVGGKTEICHVKNTGRLRELLVPGAVCYLERSHNPSRTTAYDLVAVEHGGQIVNIDSMAPNAVAREYLSTLFPDASIKAEVCFGDSRFDFVVKNEQMTTFVEVKGVTLRTKDGIARFPDAPTERGVKHIEHLMLAKEQGYGAMLLFVVAMQDVTAVAPNGATHPAFAKVLRQAEACGVALCAIDCLVQKEGIFPRNSLAVRVDL